jgi:hypothetical protein
MLYTSSRKLEPLIKSKLSKNSAFLPSGQECFASQSDKLLLIVMQQPARPEAGIDDLCLNPAISLIESGELTEAVALFKLRP